MDKQLHLPFFTSVENGYGTPNGEVLRVNDLKAILNLFPEDAKIAICYPKEDFSAETLSFCTFIGQTSTPFSGSTVVLALHTLTPSRFEANKKFFEEHAKKS